MENENEHLGNKIKSIPDMLNPFDKSLSINGGWAEMERGVNENPDASHIDKNQLNLKLNEDKENEK